MRPIPVGISDYKKLVDGGYYYVDKTLLIKDVIESGEVILIPRPRRFGKTLNISMLRYFFEISENDHQYLFTQTAIWNLPKYRALQGQFPVIFLTFKNIAETNFSSMYSTFAYTISNEFRRHAHLLSSSKLDSHEKERFERILKEKSSESELKSSLEFLSSLLARHYQKKVIILIDEYDLPTHTAFAHGFYDELLEFLRALLTAAFKDNVALEKGILTGILTLAKAGIFSGLNNLTAYNLTDIQMADKFGFTASEVDDLLTSHSLQAKKELIEAWYDGYTCGDTKGMYNPWSIINCVQEQGRISVYWANTSDNALVKKVIARATKTIKSEFELILKGMSVDKQIDQVITFNDLDANPELIWSLLLFAGYLTYESCEFKEGRKHCALRIPNEEIKYLYYELIKSIFIESATPNQAQDLLNALIQGNVPAFSELLQSFILTSISSFDLPSSEPEKSYHLFILGLLVMLSNQYEVKSNRESGFGRYDIMLIPFDLDNPGIILEFKKVQMDETFQQATERALEQIKEKKYVQDLKSRGVRKILAYGIAFQNKTVHVQSEDLS
jgi:hypothetical protein